MLSQTIEKPKGRAFCFENDIVGFQPTQRSMICSVQDQNPGSRRSFDGMLNRTQEKEMHMFDIQDRLLNISLPTI